MKIFKVVWLCLLFSSPNVWAQKKTELVFPSFQVNAPHRQIVTPNFVVYFNTKATDEAYARQVARVLEEIWRFGTLAGYRRPAFTDQYRLSVYLRREPVAGEKTRGLYNTAPPASHPYFVIKDDISHEAELKRILSHEMFHMHQQGYAAKLDLDRWLEEGSANWFADEVYPGAPYIGSSLYFIDPDFYFLWNKGISLHQDDAAHPLYRAMGYSSVVFYHYLTDYHPHGSGLIHAMLEEAFQTGERNALALIRSQLGPQGPGLNWLEDTFADFAAAVPVKTGPAPYTIHRGSEITSEIQPKMNSRDWYYKKYHRREKRIEAETFLVRPMHALYFEFKPPAPADFMLREGRLHLLLKRQNPQARIRAKVISFWSRPANSVIVRDWPSDEPMHTVENFAQDVGKVVRIVLVVANASDRAESFDLALAVLEPPFLREIIVKKGAEEIYHADFQKGELKNELSVDRDEKAIQDISVRAVFSRGLAERPQIEIEGAFVKWESPLKENSEWRGKVKTLAIPEQARERGYLQIAVTGCAPGETDLDGLPATPAKLKAELFRWDDLEEMPDKTHRIRLAATPVYLNEVRFEAGGKTYYEARWEALREKKERKLARRVDEPVDLQKIKKGKLFLTFSGPLQEMSARLAGREIFLKSPDGDNIAFEGDISLKGLSETGKIPLHVGGRDKKDKPIDGDPATKAQFPDTRYERIPDTHHRLNAEKISGNPFLLRSVFSEEDARAIYPGLPVEFQIPANFGEWSMTREEPVHLGVYGLEWYEMLGETKMDVAHLHITFMDYQTEQAAEESLGPKKYRSPGAAREKVIGRYRILITYNDFQKRLPMKKIVQEVEKIVEKNIPNIRYYRD